MEDKQLPDPETWVDRFGDSLFRVALLRLRDREAAEDAVQETFLAALNARESFAGHASPRTWLIGILKNKIVDHIRRKAREEPLGDLGSDEAFTDKLFTKRGYWRKKTIESTPSAWWANPRKILERRDFRAVLEECLDGLPGRLADAFTLREVEELSTGDICQVLDIQATNLWVMLHRARMRLRQCLEVNWFGRKRKRKR